MPRLLGLCFILVSPTLASAGGLKSSTISLKGELSVLEVQKAIYSQTGNLVADRRKSDKRDTVTLDLKDATFWQAVDALAKAVGCRVSLYEPDGQVALVDGPPRSTAMAYDGVFRLTSKRCALVRDDEAGTHSFMITVEIAWEPRLQPLYLYEGRSRVAFTDAAGRVVAKAETAGRGPTSVAGRTALEVDLRFQAPPREAVKLSSLSCAIKMLTPEKMLDFSFNRLKAGGSDEKSLEGVKVQLSGPVVSRSTWKFKVEIDNPPKNPPLESFQSWLTNNRIHLEKGDGPKKVIWPLGPASEETELETTDRAVVRYVFETDNAPAEVGMPGDWTLVYRTPGRLVEVPAAFNLKDVPLP